MALKMSGEEILPARKEVVWKMLNDPAVLKACIPGCEELEMVTDTSFTAVAKLAIGPVNARFKGKVTLEDLDPPNSYRVVGEGDGGVAGIAKGGAKVELETVDEGTRLRYTAEAQVGGKLAQIGARLIDGVAKKMAAAFFEKFADVVREAADVPTAAPPAKSIVARLMQYLRRIFGIVSGKPQ